MLYLLAHFSEYFGPFRLFDYVTFRAAGAGFTAFLLVLLLGGRFARLLRRWNTRAAGRYADLFPPEWIDKEKERTPCMGGLLLIGSALVSACLWNVLAEPLSLVMILGTAAFMGIGFIDDFRKVFRKNRDGIPARLKLLLQTVVAGLLVGTFYQLESTCEFMPQFILPFSKDPLWTSNWSALISVLAIVSASNAVNLTDGKDGLATGCTIFSLLTYAAIGYLMGHRIFASYLNIPFIPGVSEVVVFMCAITGACIGFLWHNCQPASMFMGDTGSLALGGVVGMVAVLSRQELLLVLVGGVFVMESVSVMIQVASFKLTGKRVFLCTPIHHHFERLGWTESQIVIRFWILSGVFALMALASLKLR